MSINTISHFQVPNQSSLLHPQTMSWFARSIPSNEAPTQNDQNTLEPRGVKDDLSELTQSLTRQFWGVASFLSPPARPDPPEPASRSSGEGLEDSGDVFEDSGDVSIAGIRSDLSEIGGKLRMGISKIGENMSVGEITKLASSLVKMAVEGIEEEVEEEEELVGVTEEVVAFADDLARRPENWLDFPLNEEEEEDDDGFDMTHAQQEHAIAIEHLSPRLAALRMELCPEYMSESFFWMIYFVLLHPELAKEDADVLSTPQIMDSRAMLVSQLQNESKENVDNKSEEVIVDLKDNSIAQHEESPLVTFSAPSEYAPGNIFEADIPIVKESAISSAAADYVSEKHAIASTGIQIVDKSVIEVKHADHNNDQSVHSSPSNTWDNRDDDEDDVDDWLKEETEETGPATGTTVPIENDEDVSFSDFEDDDEDAIPNLKKENYTSDKDSREWVQL